jgi:hypothetical protein
MVRSARHVHANTHSAMILTVLHADVKSAARDLRAQAKGARARQRPLLQRGA